MYTTVRGLPGSGETPAQGEQHRPRVSRVVVLLGTVSLCTDLSSEMISAILPVYLTLVLGLTPLQYGIVDGIYQGVSAAVRIAGGLGADLTRRPKAVAVVGYGLSCLCKLFLLPAQSFAAISAVIAVDRSGKGIRSAPRDAMIAAVTPTSSLGHAFGVHRAMDTVGALGGPLLAFGILALLVNAYDAIFVLSFSLAAVGVAILVLFVPNIRPRSDREESGKRSGVRGALREVAGLTKRRPYRRTLTVAGMLSVATVGDGFIFLLLKDKVGISGAMFPLLFVGTSAAYLALAVPLGRLADRVGRARVFLAGHAIAAVAYFAVWLLPPGPGLVLLVLALVGTYYAATDGVLSALTAPLVPEGVRSSGIAGVQTVVAAGAFCSALLFGWLWSRFDQQVAIAVFAVVLPLVVGLSTRLLAGTSQGPGPTEVTPSHG